jgi:hypothetical protein
VATSRRQRKPAPACASALTTDQRRVSDVTTFAFNGANVTVRFEAPGFSDWLEEVLHPGFTRVDLDVDAVTVVVRRGHARPSGGASAGSVGSAPCFTFDREVVCLPAWRRKTTIDILDEKYGARYLVQPGSPPSVEVHADGPWPRTRAALLRVVRELAVAQSLAGGQSVRLHAAALEHDGAVVLLTGPKGAGKTTLLAHLAAATGAAVVTNDCALVSRSMSDDWEVRPVPVSISVRPETLTRLPHLFQGVAAVETLMQYTLEEAALAAERHGTVTAPVRLRLSPALFAQAVNASLSPGGRLVSMCILTADEAAMGSTIRALPISEATSRLPSLRYGLEVSNHSCTIFEQLVDADGGASASAGVVTLLAAQIPCLEARIGPDVLASRAAGCDLLARLLAP